MSELRFVIFCHPEPQGSSRAFVNKRTGRAIVTSDNPKMKPFRQAITQTVLEEMAKNALGCPWAGRHVAVALSLVFYFQKPPSVSRKRTEHVVRPDLDKLARAVGDSLTGVIYQDDSQVVDLRVRKFYDVPERVEITCTQS